ncbi:unnamed protein product [Rotaria sp. Silwood2]|nr:unnamed protein product [Rotaria sp. Silwood2]CAF3114050.1 unnamed protein product [Rotaria sp. Silwood2]CAF3277052.1 unnamed protein product [Rotaria sp. Silwood2]
MLERAPRLFELATEDLHSCWPLEMLPLDLDNASVSHLIFLSSLGFCRQFYDNEQSIVLSYSSLGTQWEVLNIGVTNQTCILDLINNMHKLRVLNVPCQDTKANKMLSNWSQTEHEYQQEQDEFLERLREHLPLSYSLPKCKWIGPIRLWIR